MGDPAQGPADHLQARLDEACEGRAIQAQRRVLTALPIGVMVFPGTGIQANLADKAKKLGIPVWKFGEGSA